MLLNGFRKRERLGTEPKLRTWARESSPESTGPLSAVGRREEIGHFISGVRHMQTADLQTADLQTADLKKSDLQTCRLHTSGLS